MTTAANTGTRNGQVWFVTGVTSGVGRELARQALAADECVVGVARHASGQSDLGEDERLLSIDADVADSGAVQHAVDAAVERFERIDVVANNAGYGTFGAVEEVTDAQARAIFDTNVFGVLNVLRATLPVLRRQGSGHILQGSSFYGQTAHPGVGLLSATKYAVEGLSDALAAEVAPLGIKVTIIEPSYVATPFLQSLDMAADLQSDYDQTVRAVLEAVGQLTPKDFVSPERIASAIRTAVANDDTPLRLVLGSQGADAIRVALDARIDQLGKWAAITKSVDNPDELR
jgi:NAD(P)-dependent dehydrogenase (short-subunit alcohol dehydrogenase family)